MEIRKATEADISAVAAIYDALLDREEQGLLSTGWTRGVYPTEQTAWDALAAGTLYGALGTLVEKGWIEEMPASGGGRKREYRITAAGRSVVEGELARLRELLENGERVVEGWSR